jgi:NAD(P)-dependent dehydrogenase (short-subunit alcohol dehydrogenase family)
MPRTTTRTVSSEGAPTLHAPARSPFLNPCAFFFAALVGLAAWCVAGGLAPALTESSRAAIRGSVVVITGASSGIGAELAVQYGALGARVVIGARRAAELDAVAARVRAAGGEAVAVAGDMGAAADCEALIGAAAAHFGGLDTLIVNHAMFDDGLFLEHADAAAIERTLGAQLRINVLGAAWLLRAALPLLEASARGGRVVEVSSGTTRIASPFHPGYGASKSGSNGLFRHVAAELALLRSRVSITTCVLGMIATPEVVKDEGLRGSAYPVPDTARGIIEAGAARLKVAWVPKWIALGAHLAYASSALEHVFMNQFYTQKVPRYVEKLAAMRLDKEKKLV